MSDEASTTFNFAFGQLTLQRLPHRSNERLQAWDAADTLLLKHAESSPALSINNCLVVNDNFGALALGLQQAKLGEVWLYLDSVLTEQAIAHNAALNEQPTPKSIPAHQPLPTINESQGTAFKTVYLKIPKSLSLLKWQLEQVRQHCPVGTKIIAGGMVKHLGKGVFSTFEEVFSEVSTSLAEKKARLLFATVKENKAAGEDGFVLSAPELDINLHNRAGVYSRASIDRGSRLLVNQFANQLPTLPCSASIIDLGCGNGLLGIMAQRILPKATLHFTDVSYLAVDSARINFANNHPNKSASFTPAHTLESIENPVDLILCNPPFHQGHLVDDQIAQLMISTSKTKLKPSGQLWLVGNRHLNYHLSMKRCFGNVKQIASDAKFVVLSSCA